LLDGRGREEEDVALAPVNFRELEGDVLMSRPVYIPPSGADLSWGPDEYKRFSLCAAANRVTGLAVHAKTAAYPRTRWAAEAASNRAIEIVCLCGGKR